MRSISVDTDVFSMIWSLRTPPEESENAILRRIIKEYQKLTLNLAAVEAAGEESLMLEVNKPPTNLAIVLQSPSRVESTSRAGTEYGDKTMPYEATYRDKRFSRKIRWVDDILAALKNLGGEASLHEIYKSVEVLRRAGGRSIPKTLEATIRRTLEDHCDDSANFRGISLFIMPYGHGKGIWALKNNSDL